jgi:hypothetical protein
MNKEQLGNQIAHIVRTYALDNEGQGLNWWYFMNLHGMNRPEVEEVFCDGSGDLGIDAIFIDTTSRVHFYQFKNPQKLNIGFPTGEVDKVLSGLQIIMAKKYSSIGNPALRDRIEEVYKIVPSGYTLHLVTSGAGIELDADVKLRNFIESLKAPTNDFFEYQVEDLKALQDRFYTRNLPAIDESIQFELQKYSPYMVRADNHDSYIFHVQGDILAQLYERFGERLLQQNIRGSVGDKGTNAAILDSCTTIKATNFYHFNNGITFLCEEAKWDNFTSSLILDRAQVVNGGQTLRVLHKAYMGRNLKPEVVVSVRVITSRGDKEFAGNVAVNLNNQTRVESSFLRSNDPRIVQLATALASAGWYLERKEGEVKDMSEADKQALTNKLGHPLSDDIIIPLKEGAQSYAATYRRLPGIAKRNPKFIFLDSNDNGYFSSIFGPDISAERFINAYRLYRRISTFVDNFKILKRKQARGGDRKKEYIVLLGSTLVNDYESDIDQVIPQSVIFLCALLFEKYVKVEGWSMEQMLETIREDQPSIATDILYLVIKFSKEHPKEAGKSWPTLMKNDTFFEQVAAYIKGRYDASTHK